MADPPSLLPLGLVRRCAVQVVRFLVREQLLLHTSRAQERSAAPELAHSRERLVMRTNQSGGTLHKSRVGSCGCDQQERLSGRSQQAAWARDTCVFGGVVMRCGSYEMATPGDPSLCSRSVLRSTRLTTQIMPYTRRPGIASPDAGGFCQGSLQRHRFPLAVCHAARKRFSQNSMEANVILRPEPDLVAERL